MQSTMAYFEVSSANILMEYNLFVIVKCIK